MRGIARCHAPNVLPLRHTLATLLRPYLGSQLLSSSDTVRHSDVVHTGEDCSIAHAMDVKYLARAARTIILMQIETEINPRTGQRIPAKNRLAARPPLTLKRPVGLTRRATA